MKVKDGIIGFVVGDALGVPVEFHSRNEWLSLNQCAKAADVLINLVIQKPQD